MALKDMESQMKEVVALPIQAISSDTTTNGAAVDMQGYEAVTFLPVAGAVTDGDYTPLILEGDDSNVSNASAVADADLLPSGTGQEASAALDTANTASKIGYRGTKRYVFCSIVSANTASGATVGVVGIQECPSKAPVA